MTRLGDNIRKLLDSTLEHQIKHLGTEAMLEAGLDSMEAEIEGLADMLMLEGSLTNLPTMKNLREEGRDKGKLEVN